MACQYLYPNGQANQEDLEYRSRYCCYNMAAKDIRRIGFPKGHIRLNQEDR